MGSIDQLFSRSMQSYESQQQLEMPLLAYLDLCRRDPMAYASAAERLVAAIGEAFRSHFETPALHRLLRELGFTGVHDLGPREIAARLSPAAPPPAENGGHILHAWRRP